MMGKLELPFLLLSLFVCGISSTVLELSGVETDEIMPMSKSHASARILFYPHRNISWNDVEDKSQKHLKNVDAEIQEKLPPFVNRRLFMKVLMDHEKEEMEPSTLEKYENPIKERFQLQELHLRYLMASTAEQPDNSGRTSSFSIWLTFLIAALAAAILS